MSCCKGHICQCLSRIFRREAAVTVSRGHGTRTGRQLVEGVLGLALGLLWLGIQRGDVVAIAALNSEWYVEWLLAVAFVGGIAAPLNYRWSVEEARSAVELVNPVMLVVDESCRGWVPELQGGSALPSLKYHVLMGEFPCCFSGNGSVTDECGIKMPVEDPAFDHIWAPEDIALICFTSGTTGRPKGVAISHMALIIQSSAKIATVGYSEDDVYLHTAPLCHIGGISSCITVLLVGGCHVFIPRFDAKIATRAIEQHQVTSLITVPAMVADLASFLGKENRWIGGESVKKVLNGGGGLSHDLTGAAMKIFPHAKLISAYGMTETCSSLTFMVLHDPASRVTGIQPQKMNRTISDSTVQLGSVCVGKPPPHVELCVSGNGNKDGPLVGNILTRGPHVMVRYWNGVTEGASVQRLNGWLDSGDIGWLDGNGELWLVGRTKDRLKSGGENVYPEEVEAVLVQHPGISCVVVLGIPDVRLTEMVAACVCIREGWEWVDCAYDHSKDRKLLSTHILQNHCRLRNLSRFKIPKICIPWKKPFPYTTTGKLKREEVRQEAISYLQFPPSSL